MNAFKFSGMLILFLLVLTAGNVWAQETPVNEWDGVKIKGARQEIYRFYNGNPYLFEKWSLGKVTFANGQEKDSLFLKYSSYKDELIYFNKNLNAQIKIDRQSISAFSFTDPNGQFRSFRKQRYDNTPKSDRYFEILSSGETDLLCYRKVNLKETSPYYDASGKLKNMAYEMEYVYYFFNTDRGYTSLKTNKLSFLSKFDKANQKAIKKLLRKNKIKIEDENSLMTAWKVTEKNGYKVNF